MTGPRLLFIAAALVAATCLRPAGGMTADRRPAVRSVSIHGMSTFDDKRLKSLMVTRPSSLFHRRLYHEEVLRDDIESIQLFYHRNGFLAARVSDWSAITDSTRARTAITITVHEGDRTIVDGVSLMGNETIPDDRLAPLVTVVLGDPLLSARVEASTIALLRYYADNGFLEAQIQPDMRIAEDSNRAIVDFVITENRLSKIGDIEVTGLDMTKPSVITRELTFKSGETVNYTRLLESQRAVYLTGLFQSVFIKPDPPDSTGGDRRTIRVDVREKQNGEFSLAAGYGSVERARSKIELSTANLGGAARKAGFTGILSEVQRRGELSFSEPWTMGIPWRTDTNLFGEYTREPGYKIRRLGGSVTTGRTFTRHVRGTVKYRYEAAKLSRIRVTEVPERLRATVNSLTTSLVRDSRDTMFDATRGTYAEATVEVGAFSGSSDGFIRTTGAVRLYRTIAAGTVAATSLEAGWIGTGGGLGGIPLQERFYTGGPQSVRGFAYRKVGPLDSRGYPVGGSIRLVWNIIEIRRRLFRMISGAVFADTGSVWTAGHGMGLDDLRTSAGAGLRFSTPVGTARFDYGFNLDPRSGESGGMAHFSMGQAF